MKFSKGDKSAEGSRIKALMYGPYPLPDRAPYGGVERAVTTLVDSLSKFDSIDISVISRRDDDIKEDFQIEKDDVKIYYFAKRRPKIISTLVRDLPALRKKIEEINPDIVHSQGSDGAYTSLKAGYPTVMTLHGMIWREVRFYRGVKGVGRRIIYPRLTRYVLKRLKHLVLISPYVDEEVRNLTDAKKYFIDNPIPDRFFEIKNKNIHPRIFYLGVINSRKDPLTLIKAILIIKEEIPEVELRIAGKITDEKYYKTIVEYTSKSNLGNSVSFLCQLEDKEIEEEYSTCSLFCLPSRQETAPMVIAEAMASGKPVVATNICGIPYMIDDGKTGFIFEPGDVQSLAEKIIALLQDDDLRYKMGNQAKEVAKKKWNAEIIAKKTIEVYKEILSREGKKV